MGYKNTCSQYWNLEHQKAFNILLAKMRAREKKKNQKETLQYKAQGEDHKVKENDENP